MKSQEFRYKLDFYYQQALIYLLTMVLYAGVKGTFVETNFTLVFDDPLFYIIGFFVLSAFTALLLNIVRDRKVIVSDQAIIFRHRFNERVIDLKEVEWVHVGKERLVQTAGRFQVILIKVLHRRRAYRIRLGRYERERELLRAVEEVSEHLPKRQQRFHFRRKR